MCVVFFYQHPECGSSCLLTDCFNRLRNHVRCRQPGDKEKQKSVFIKFHFKENEVHTVKVSLRPLESVVDGWWYRS